MILCPNDGCGEQIQRCKIRQHRKECPFELASCKYSNIGCLEKALWKDLNDHERDSQLHLQLAIDTVHKQNDKIKEQRDMLLRQEVMLELLYPSPSQAGTGYRFRVTGPGLPCHSESGNQMYSQAIYTSHGGSISNAIDYRFKVSKFNRHKKQGNEVYSPAFYTSHGGYMMCICVHANGHAHNKGTCVSVFASLMRGENDDHLPWPFTGTVTFELLNQLEDTNHHSRVATFPYSHKASQRVMDGERAPIGYGYSCYISHSSLGYDEVKHCQYLKDDCLYFKVTVDAEATTKPWLV